MPYNLTFIFKSIFTKILDGFNKTEAKLLFNEHKIAVGLKDTLVPITDVALGSIVFTAVLTRSDTKLLFI